MNKRMTTAIQAVTSIGPKINGWVKVGVVLAGVVAGFATLKANVGHLEEEVARVEEQTQEDISRVEEQTREELRDINRKLDQLILQTR